MNKDAVKNIIEATLKSGNKTPGLLDVPKALSVKSKLEACSAIPEVIGILEDRRSFITKSFGVSDSAYNEAIEKIKTLGDAA